MRYSIFGGEGSVAQNVHASFIYAREDIDDCKSRVAFCPIIDMTEMLELSQYTMMYVDEECCNNGHRDNILDPYHTHVSLGISYDDYYFAYVQNFENIYLGSPSVKENDGYVRISGTTLEDKPSYIAVTYDEYPTVVTYERDHDKSSCDGGELVAYILDPLDAGYRIAPGSRDYHVIEATRWKIDSNELKIEFSLHQVMEKNGRGVYTLWLYQEENDHSIDVLSHSIFKEYE
jgi:hypothetical protein